MPLRLPQGDIVVTQKAADEGRGDAAVKIPAVSFKCQ